MPRSTNEGMLFVISSVKKERPSLQSRGFVPAGYKPIDVAWRELLEEWHGQELRALEDQHRRALPEPTGDAVRDAIRSCSPPSADLMAKAKPIVEASLNKFRQLLFNGTLSAVYLTPSGASTIPANLWATSETDGVIETGDYFPFGRPVSIYQRVTVERVFIVATDLDRLSSPTTPEAGAMVVKRPAQRAEPTQRKARGPDPSKREQVKAHMRAIDRGDLAAMKEESMKLEFGASRDTCRLARQEVLAEFVEDQPDAKLRQTPTIDN